MANSQTWKAEDYEQHAPFVAELGVPVIDLLTVAPPARVLDLGCGDGVLTRKLCERGYTVVGVDASAAMVRAASARGVDARVADGHALPFVDAFDAVFSNAALHWLLRPDEAIASVHRALRANGQFAGELGGAGNIERLVSVMVACLDARGVRGGDVVPWYFPSAGEYATRLERAGFRVDFISHFDRPTALPSDLLDWIATFGESFTHALPEAERADYLSEVRARLVPALIGPDGSWLLDYVRLRFRATKR